MPSFEIGTELQSVHKSMSQGMIDAWADLSGDTNPLHIDPEYAKTTRFGGTIAHGHIALGFLCEMMVCWWGPDWYRVGTLRGIKFVAPIRPGDDVKTLGKVIDIVVADDQSVVVCEISVVDGETGTACVVGSARIESELPEFFDNLLARK